MLRTLKSVVPVALKQPIKDWLAAKAPATYSGDYPSFAAARDACGPQGGYETQAVLEHYRRGYATLAGDMPPHMFRRVVPVMAALSFCQPVARVVDVGGAYGEYYHRLRYLMPAFDPVWDIVETPAVCGIAGELGASDRKRFFTTDTLPPGEVSLTIASGVIQCLPDPVAALGDVFAVGAPYVLLSRLPVAPALARHRVLVQRASIAETAFPVWFFARMIFDEIAKHGRILFDFTIAEDVVALDGTPFCYSGCLVRAG